MNINPIVKFNIQNLGKNVKLPNSSRNYCTFDDKKLEKIAQERESALPHLDAFLKTNNNEKAVCEALYTIDKMLDKKVKGVEKLYPTLSKFNKTKSPNIQVLLCGIYRKTLIPDAFGPMCAMLINQIQNPNSPYFDPTEEIGGAIFEYIRTNNKKD